jgi:hypothetical protein
MIIINKLIIKMFGNIDDMLDMFFESAPFINKDNIKKQITDLTNDLTLSYDEKRYKAVELGIYLGKKLNNLTFLCKIPLYGQAPNYPNVVLQQYTVYFAFYQNEIIRLTQIDDQWIDAGKLGNHILNQAKEGFEIMYPRWFTLYHFFKTQDDIPLDIFINIIKYYVDIKDEQLENNLNEAEHQMLKIYKLIS